MITLYMYIRIGPTYKNPEPESSISMISTMALEGVIDVLMVVDGGVVIRTANDSTSSKIESSIIGT